MKNIQIISRYEFCAAHQLFVDEWDKEKNQEVFGHCTRLHGHQYQLEAWLSGPPDPKTGMLLNAYQVDEIVKNKVIDQLDHHFLNNDIEFFKTHQPTAEWIAFWCYENLKNAFPKPVALKKIRIFETPNFFVEYSE